jgi:hypothetical protein
MLQTCVKFTIIRTDVAIWTGLFTAFPDPIPWSGGEDINEYKAKAVIALEKYDSVLFLQEAAWVKADKSLCGVASVKIGFRMCDHSK